jgi:steroid 5-alpha reductase family enzyme
MPIFFNIVNGFVNGFYIGFVDGHSGKIPSLITGLGFVIFFAGFYINNKADLKLIHLRQLQNGYQIPRGWMFDYISCPNHFGEIAEWIGFAIIARNPAALSFAIWTFCNLGPRARNHHEWYNEKFTDYPTKRKALIPFVW